MNFFGTMVLCKNFFLMHMHLQDIFFQNHPSPPSEVEWSAPNGTAIGKIIGKLSEIDSDFTIDHSKQSRFEVESQ